jgi:two-component SAPR family response regulator
MLHSVEESIDWFSKNEHPDLIFLDIQYQMGCPLKFFEKVSIKSAVIFTTAYDEYALRAFKLNSIDYLLKPIDEDDLEAAVTKFKSLLPKQNYKLKILPSILSKSKKMLTNPFEKPIKAIHSKIGQHLN